MGALPWRECSCLCSGVRCWLSRWRCFFFFFNDTATTEIYTLSLHDALPISLNFHRARGHQASVLYRAVANSKRSEEHTSELQSRSDLVCRLLLEKKQNE